MGSSFLLAHGMGKPVADAVTTFDCPAAGTYHVWARTRNWTAPWSGHAAGTFTVKVNGKGLPSVLGRGAGGWLWQKAGEVRLEKGSVSIALHDLTGFDGRCDAVCITSGDEVPSRPAAPVPSRTVKADLVVAGGGIAGTCAAIDPHYPMPRNKRHYDGEPFRSICTHNRHYAYPIPYRCLYSRNVANLFMAGRNISVTHVALGTTRVMRTTGMMGEVVGMAARVCKEHGCLPRGVYEYHLDDLKALMKKGVGTGKPQPPQNYNCGALIRGTPAHKKK